MTVASPTLTIRNRPRSDGTVRWFLWIRRPAPAENECIDVKGYTKLEDRPAVEAFAAPYRKALKKGLAEPKPEDCDGFFARYVAYQKEQGSTDADKKATRWNKWISPRIGHRRPEDVTREHVEDIRDALDAAILAWEPGKAAKNGTCLSGKTAMNVWTALTSTFKAATNGKRRELRVLNGKPNPCAGVLPPGEKGSRNARLKSFLYPKEATALLACPDVPLEWRDVYAVALYTYLRPGELRVLTCRDIDLDARHVDVRKAWDYSEGKVKPPKTAAGIRKVPIEPALVPVLERLKKGRQPGDLVVPCLSAFGEDHLAQLFRKHLLAACVDRVELHESTRTHVQANFRSCRDSGITWLAMRGLDVTKMKRRAGHDKLTTTDGYVKLAEDLTGDLGVPFGPIPTDAESCSPHVPCSPSDPPSVEDDSRIADEIVPEEGVETAANTYIPEGTPLPCSPNQRDKTADDDMRRSGELARLAAKARLLARLTSGDERVLATELATELEALVGPSATIIPIASRR